MNLRSVMTVLAMIALFLIGLTYVLFGVVQIDPFNRPMKITVNLARSGGLLDHSQVTYRGYPIGRVNDIELRPGGVQVVVNVDEGTRIPTDTDVSVSNLSAAGEQFIDFRPRSDRAPFLADGSVVDQRDTHTAVPFAEVVTNLSGLVGSVDPSKVSLVVGEMQKAFGGSAQDIQRILDGGDVLLGGLQSVLPQTVDLLHNGRTVLTTVSDLRPDLIAGGNAARDLSGRLRDDDPTVRHLLDTVPDTVDLVREVGNANGATIGRLIDDMATVSEVPGDRLPALSQLLPNLAKLGPTAQATIRDGKLQVLADAYPRPNCDYGGKRPLPTVRAVQEPHIYRYCTRTEPDLQQRGAANAPRPNGDDTAGPPKGADPTARAQRPSDAPGS